MDSLQLKGKQILQMFDRAGIDPEEISRRVHNIELDMLQAKKQAELDKLTKRSSTKQRRSKKQIKKDRKRKKRR